MADNSNDIKYLKEELEEAIKDGVELFKYYKEISKEFQEKQKIIMNNQDYEKNLKNEINKISERRKDILKRRQSKKLSESDIKLSNLLNAELANKEKFLKSDQYRQKYKQEHNKLSEIYLVNSNKKFLKEKEKLRKEKIRILSRIKIALAQLKKKMFKDEFTDFIKYLNGDRYNIADNKQITFKKLMHHLESAEISEEVAKTTKKIDELMTIGNVVNRKKKMEIGIKQKEIQKLLENYEKTNKLSKESVKKDITNLVKSLNRITNAKKKEEVTTKIDRLSRSLKNEMTERERKIKYDIQIKTQELKELEKSL
jgi:hypothetical protein